MPRCPICNKDVQPRAQNSAFPFCSTRCKAVDLGKWLNEEYRMPAEDTDDEGPEDVAPPNAARPKDGNGEA